MKLTLEEIDKIGLATDLAYFGERMLNMEIVDHHEAWSGIVANEKRISINAARDHGKCLSGDSLILMANGVWKSIESVEVGEHVLSEGQAYRINHVWRSGEKPVFDLVVAGGRRIRATSEHKFWKDGGWVKLGDLKSGDWITIPKTVTPITVSSVSDAEVKLLAFAIAEGNMTGSNFHITNNHPKIRDEIRESAKEMGWDTKYSSNRFCTKLTNNCAKVGSPQEWCRKYGIWGKLAYHKRVPKEIFSATTRQVELFLNRFFACDGWINRNQIGLTLANEHLIEDIQKLLMRVGVYARKSIKLTSSGNPTFNLMIQNVGDAKQFLETVGYIYTKEEKSFELYNRCLEIKPVWRDVKVVDDNYVLAKVENITSVGVEPVFDIEVEGKHEFVADGFKVHNSFFFSFAYVLWRLYFNWIPSLPSADFKSIPRQALGYIFSASQDKAIEFLEMVKAELETNPKFQHLVPSRRESWSKTEIRCSNGATVRARGWGVAVRGGHPCWLVADDVLSDENIYSEMTRNKSIDYFYSAVTPMVIPGGQLIVVGTPMHSQDLYADLRKNTEYHFSKFAAVKEDGTALWPTRYNLNMLKSRRQEIGSIRFAREYECVPVSDDSSLFPERVVKENFDPNCSLVTEMTPSLRNDYEVYTGVDLAMSSAVGADYTAIITIGVDRYHNKRIFDIRRMKGKQMTEQLRVIQDVYHTYRPARIYIEDNQFQRIFRDEIVRNTDMPVEGFTTTAKHKNSLERGIPSLQILFENKKWIIPRRFDRDRRLTDILVGELRCFTYVNGKLEGVGSHDDTVMALWMAHECSNASTFSFSF